MPTGPETRKAHHQNRIKAARNGVMRFWWAACWVMSELKQLARRDQAKAHATGLHLTDQLLAIARDLNSQHHDQLKPKGGGSRVV